MRPTPLKSVTDRVHFPLLLSAVALVAYGTAMVWSATSGMEAHQSLIVRHVVGIALGLIPLAVLWIVDYQMIKPWSGPLTALLCFLIVAPRIPFIGDSAKGATSWLQIGSVRLFQPSEPAKLLFILVMASVIAEFEGRIEQPRDVAKVAGYIALPVVLIMVQPDLGTGLVFVVVAMGMLLIGGLKGRYFAVFALIGVLLTGIALATPILKDYQKDRLLVFVDPARDPGGAGYNLAQSKIAIGSGGLTGKGLRSGTQSNLNFIPERHTDFVFSVLGEQLGFLGAVTLLALYLFALGSALSIAASSRDLYGSLIAAGVLTFWLFQVLENIGMSLGMMPITGIPLPFMSFGSTFMVTNMAAVGILLSVWSRRYGT